MYINKDLAGQRFCKLIVIGRAPDREYPSGEKDDMWYCKCDCDNNTELIVSGYNLTKGLTTDCGCRYSGRLINMLGQKFGHLTVIKKADDHIDKSGNKEAMWLCECDCPNHTILAVRGHSLRNGHTTSCGCARKSEEIGGESGTKLYHAWLKVKKNPHCKEWDSYKAFKEWAESAGFVYEDDLDSSRDCMLIRLDKDKEYSPDNCIFGDAHDHANYRKNNITLTFNGITMTVAQWATELGVSEHMLYNRLKLGWSVERTLTEGIADYIKTVQLSDGNYYTLTQLSEKYGLDRKLLYDRIFRQGWDPDKAINTPVIDRALKITYNGDTFSASQWARIRGYNNGNIIAKRLKKGYSVEESLNGSEDLKSIPMNAIYFVEDGIPYSEQEWDEKEKQKGDNR